MERMGLLYRRGLARLRERPSDILSFLVPALAFAIALAILCAVFSGAGIALTGHLDADHPYTGMLSDAISQYVPYFRALRRILQGDGDLFYDLGKFYGGNMLSLVSYYLFSPFNLLLVIFPSAPVEVLMVWIQILKLAVGAATCGVFLMRREPTCRNGLANVGFAVAYALCGFGIIYSWDLFWLDGFLVLPLVALGVERIAAERRYFIYTTSLAYALITSWYIGFMVCAFAVIYFFTCYFEHPYKTPTDSRFPSTRSDRLGPILTFGLASLAGGFIALPLWQSLLTGMDGTKVGFSMAEGLRNPFDLIRSLLTGSYGGFASELATYAFDTYVGIFVGGVTLVFASLYFFSRKQDPRRRLTRLGLVIVYLFILLIMPLDTLMHGGAVPTWFNCRYAFVCAFILVMLGAEGYEGIGSVSLLSLIVPLIWLAVGICTAFLYTPYEGYEFTLSSAGLAIYVVTYIVALAMRLIPVLLERRVGSRFIPYPRIESFTSRYGRWAGVGAAALVSFMSCYGLYVNADHIIGTNAEDNQYNKSEQYRQAEAFQTDVDTIQEYAGTDAVYRMENTFIAMPTNNLVDNDPLYFGYDGVSVFSSTDRRDQQNFHNLLGMLSNGFFSGYSYGSTLTANSLLSIRYILDRGDNPGFNLQSCLTRLDLPSASGVTYYQNPYQFPLVFAAEGGESIRGYWDGAEHVNEDGQPYYWINQFEWQDRIIQQLLPDLMLTDTPDERHIFEKVAFDYLGPSSVEETYLPSGEHEGFISANSLATLVKVAVYERYGVTRIIPTFDIMEGAVLSFSFESDGTMPAYWYFKDLYVNQYDVRYYMDGHAIENGTYWKNGIVSFPLSAGRHLLQVRFNADYENLEIRAGIYFENLDLLQEVADALRANSVNDTLRFSGSSLMRGTLTLQDDHPSNLFIGVPYESGLRVSIDGVSRPVSRSTEIFSQISLDGIEPGEHEIVIRFVDRGFQLGLIISSLTMLWVSMSLYLVPWWQACRYPFVLEGRFPRLPRILQRLRRMLRGVDETDES